MDTFVQVKQNICTSGALVTNIITIALVSGWMHTLGRGLLFLFLIRDHMPKLNITARTSRNAGTLRHMVEPKQDITTRIRTRTLGL